MEVYYAKDADGNIQKFIIGKTRVTLEPLFNPYKDMGTVIGFDHRRGRCYRVKWDSGYEDTNHHGTELFVHSAQEVASDNPNESFKTHRREDK